MSTKAVRWNIPPRPPAPRRGAFDRFVVRSSRLTRFVAAWMMRLPVGSRLRHAAFDRALTTGWDAVSRMDLEVASFPVGDRYTVYAAQRPDGAVDLDPVYRGREGLERMMASWHDPWDDVHFQPRHVIDLGERMVVYVRLTARGRGSGIAIDEVMGMVYRLEMGEIIEHRTFWSWDEALAEAGLPLEGDRPPMLDD